jgi:transcription-repair coupling factor (superfamily II helicase)
MIPGRLLVSRSARERLRALEEFSELGSGYRIAQLDLKIRGAGNILGEVQSGHIHRIGYELYLDLLQRSIRELKGEKVTEEIEPEIQIPAAAYLPDDYVLDPQDRVMLYRRLSRIRTETELFDIKGELLDRFGPIPEPAAALLGIIALKNLLRAAKVKLVKREGRALRFAFAAEAPVVPEKVISLVNENPRKFRLVPQDEILVVISSSDIPGMVLEISDILKRIMDGDTLNSM